MAVTGIHYVILRNLFERGVLSSGGALLELGEANWYGDLPPLKVLEDIQALVKDPERRDALVRRITEVVEHQTANSSFDIVKIYYELFFAPSEMQAIDFHGSETAQKLDLNGPITLNRRFDVVINNGTAEHIFNIGQVFRTMHDYTVPGGMMLHEGPFVGWIDHGFYTLQPTLFFDLAERNRYEICGMYVGKPGFETILQIRTRDDVHELAKANRIPDNSLLFVYFRKDTQDSPFEIPMQGYYREGLSEAGMAAWRALR
jgi:hypothetical protein